MDMITYLSKGTGLNILLAAAVLLFAGFSILIIRSPRRAYAGRILIPVAFIELVAIFFILSLAFPDKGEGVGPAVVPMLWMFSILAISLLLLVQAIKRMESEDPAWGRVDLVLKYLILIILYLAVMNFMGYYLSTFLFIIIGIRMLDYKNWKVILPLAAGVILFSYIAFHVLLYVPLPGGTVFRLIF